MDQKYLTDSESLSLNIEATCLLLSSPRNFPYEIKMDKYRPYPSMISMFTSDSQHPPRSRHAVHLGDNSMCWSRGGQRVLTYPNGILQVATMYTFPSKCWYGPLNEQLDPSSPIAPSGEVRPALCEIR